MSVRSEGERDNERTEPQHANTNRHRTPRRHKKVDHFERLFQQVCRFAGPIGIDNHNAHQRLSFHQ